MVDSLPKLAPPGKKLRLRAGGGRAGGLLRRRQGAYDGRNQPQEAGRDTSQKSDGTARRTGGARPRPRQGRAKGPSLVGAHAREAEARAGRTPASPLCECLIGWAETLPTRASRR
ncbi:unnamed protein product, partial [Amoebophrya sp. A120]